MLIEVEENILFCAFRYALGRMTYIVGQVGDTLILNVDKLSLNCKKQIVYEIREKEYRNELGMECDKKAWLNVKKILLDSLPHVQK